MVMRETGQEAFVAQESHTLTLSIGRFVWPMHVLSAIILTAVLYGNVPDIRLLPWAVWMIVLAGVQAFICFQGTARARTEPQMSVFATGFDLTAILLAAGWGWLGFALYPSGILELEVFLGFMIGGAILTGAGTHNLHFGMLTLTLFCIVPPFAARLVLENEMPQGAIAATMLALFMALMLGLGWLLRGFIRRGLALQWEKDQLAAELAIAHGIAVEANAAKSRFLAQASHDLRQPIHSMGLFLAALTKEDLPARGGEIVGRLEQSVDVLSKLFNSLLDVTLLETGEASPDPSSFAVDDLLNDIAEEFAPAATAASLTIDVRPSGLSVCADPLILRRIVQNIVSNAIRHSECSQIVLAAREDANGTLIDVTDNGRGIPEEDRQRIFEEFARGGTQGGGLGLGLFIVQRLANMLDMEVALSIPSDGGSRFTIGPLQQGIPEDAHTANARAAKETAAQEPGNGRVLIIDDDAETLEATRAILADWGWDVSVCRSLDAAGATSMETPTLVVSDFDLGAGRTGLDAVAALRAHHGEVPALIISGSSAPEVKDAVQQAGLILLQKPVRPVQLRSAILGVLD